jgi:hypothetical protein
LQLRRLPSLRLPRIILLGVVRECRFVELRARRAGDFLRLDWQAVPLAGRRGLRQSVPQPGFVDGSGIADGNDLYGFTCT